MTPPEPGLGAVFCALSGRSDQRDVRMMRGPSNKVNEGPHEESAFALHGERTERV